MREISFFTFCVILIQYNSSGNRIAVFDSVIVEYLVFLYIDNPHCQFMGLFFPPFILFLQISSSPSKVRGGKSSSLPEFSSGEGGLARRSLSTTAR